MIEKDLKQQSTIDLEIYSYSNDQFSLKKDSIIIEEPLEIRLIKEVEGKEVSKSIAIIMRTPGNDFELACGFLLSEGIIKGKDDILSISYIEEGNIANVVGVKLKKEIDFNSLEAKRNFYVNSSCGICGKAAIDFLLNLSPKKPIGDFKVDKNLILSLPEMLSKEQKLFSKTGGLHATGLFSIKGEALIIREDVGRHNAFDKVIGSLLLNGKLPAYNSIAVVSGRASFEIVQKAVIAGIPMLVSVGAPSSLAIALAMAYDITLVGFVREKRFNIYSGEERIYSIRRFFD